MLICVLCALADTGADDMYGRPPPMRGQLAKELGFLDKVKTRLRSKEQYGDFLKCLNMYSQEIISKQELVQLVADILGRTPELMVRTGAHKRQHHASKPTQCRTVC